MEPKERQLQNMKTTPETMEYDVRGSDTLASIALKFNTTTSKLARMNRLSSRLLYPGQTLFVPVKIDLLEKEAQRKNERQELELVSRPPKSLPFPRRQDSLSPDHQIEELLKKDENGTDELSEKYLRINGRYITDGQGVVPGVLLVTPQTIMFNPCVSDHLVIDRGREAYTVRAPMKGIKKVAYYEDIAAMVLGDTSAEFIPELVVTRHNDTRKQINDTMDTSNYVSQDSKEVFSESHSSNIREQSSTEPMSLDETSSGYVGSKQGDNSDVKIELNQVELSEQMSQESSLEMSKEISEEMSENASNDMSQDDTFTNCSCSKMSIDETFSHNTKDGISDQSTVNETMADSRTESRVSGEMSDSRGIFTNHDRGNEKVVETESDKDSEIAGIATQGARITREDIDITDTKCTSTPRKVQENSIKTSKVDMRDDSGLIYTKIETKNSIKRLTGNAIKLEKDTRIQREKPREPFVYVEKTNTLSFNEDESSSHIDASRDSGISEGSSFQTTNSSFRASTAMRDNTDDHRQLSPRSSSLSIEARQWLGKRGITVSNESEDEGQYSETASMSHEEVVTPRPSTLTADDLSYLCLKIHRSYWCKSSTFSTNIMGVPHNRDQQRMEHWFAVPNERVNRLHTFFETWKGLRKKHSDEHLEDAEKSTDGLSIIDDTFARPSVEELLVDRFEQGKRYIEPYQEGFLRNSPASESRKSTFSSLTEDDIPELTDNSNILERLQIAAVSRELPSRTVGHRWNLVYSTAVHGISLKTLYRNTQNLDTPILLVVVDQDGKTFGAFMSDSPRVSEGFYGTGESMLFTFKDQNRIKAYRWTGTNSFFIKGDSQCLAIGGGDGLFGLWLDEDLNHGRSHSCKTFDNETLSSKEDFICRGLEAWSFG